MFPLNLISFVFLFVDVVLKSTTPFSFKVSNVKNSENGFVLNVFESFCGITLSRAKTVLVNEDVPSVICLPTKKSLNVSAPLAA